MRPDAETVLVLVRRALGAATASPRRTRGRADVVVVGAA